MKRLLFVLAIALAIGIVGVAQGAAKKGRKDSGTAYVTVVHQVGKQEIAAGDLKDKLLGPGAIVYQITVSAGPPSVPGASVTIKANKVTLFTSQGSLSGTGQAVQTINADGTGNVQNGSVKLTKGTGGLKGHSLTATFSGPFNGSFYTFTYKGTYK
jgi:hypothetical protein